jgi:hypothetical protein
VWVEIPSTLRAILDDRNATADQLRRVAADCEAMGRNSVPGLMCVARAQITLANHDEAPRENFGQARCNAYRASQLARSRSEPRRRAEALWAESLVGLISNGVGDPESHRTELERVHGAQAAAMVHTAMADMAVARNDEQGAREEVGHLRDHAQERALVLINIAQLQRRMGQSEAVIRRTLEEAVGADSSSVGTNAALGRAYFEMGRDQWRNAEPYLRTAVQTRPAPAGDVNAQERANFHLSVIEADRGNMALAEEYADDAGNDAQAQRQKCLVRLLQGGNAVYHRVQNANGDWREEDAEGEDRCTELRATAEGQLLAGMFWLRRAQYLADAHGTLTNYGRERFQGAVSNANRAFSEGSRLLGQSNAKLNWPGRPDIELEDMLGYADRLRQFYAASCQRGADPNVSGDQLFAEQIFEYYRIVRPRGMEPRCLPG